MSTVSQDELKAIKLLKFTGTENEWDHWSELFVDLARAGGFAGILLCTEQAPRADEDIDEKKSDGSYELTDAKRKEKKRLRLTSRKGLRSAACSSKGAMVGLKMGWPRI